MKNKSHPDQLPIDVQMQAMDCKDRKFRQRLTEPQQKKLSTYLLMRYSASVSGNSDLQSYYLLSANEKINKHFFDIKHHPELQWLCCTAVSPGLGAQKHYWFNGFAKSTDEEKYLNKLIKVVSEKLPGWKLQDIELWVELAGIQEVEQWILNHGDSLPKKA